MKSEEIAKNLVSPLMADLIGSDIDAYGEFTVQHWFSNPEQDDPNTEDLNHKGPNRSLTIMSFGLAGETGEVLEKIKKLYRDGTFDPAAVQKELGDVFFYLCRLSRFLGWNPSEVLAANVAKLQDRRRRNVLGGSGDNR